MDVDIIKENSVSELSSSNLFVKSSIRQRSLFLLLLFFGGALGCVCFYFLWGWIGWGYSFLAIPCSIVVGVAFVLLILEIIKYFKRTETEYSDKMDLSAVSHEDISSMITRRAVLTVISLIIGFLSFYLIFPIFIAAAYSSIVLQQVFDLKAELSRRNDLQLIQDEKIINFWKKRNGY